MVFIPESEVFLVCSASVFKGFQRGPTKYSLPQKILSCHIFLKIQDSKNTWPTFSSYQVVSQLSGTYLPLHQMRTELGLLKRLVLPATNTAGALQQFQTEIASLAFGRLIGLVILCIFLPIYFPLDCCSLCFPGLYIKGQDWICFFVVVVIFLHFFIDLENLNLKKRFFSFKCNN